MVLLGVIFEMIARGDVAEAGAALVMLDAYRGELGAIISTIKDQNDKGRSLVGDIEGVNKQEGYTFRKTEAQDTAEEENQIAGTGTLTNTQPKKIKKVF